MNAGMSPNNPNSRVIATVEPMPGSMADAPYCAGRYASVGGGCGAVAVHAAVDVVGDVRTPQAVQNWSSTGASRRVHITFTHLRCACGAGCPAEVAVGLIAVWTAVSTPHCGQYASIVGRPRRMQSRLRQTRS